MSVIESSPTRTASEGHATVGAAAVLRLVPRRPVKWGSDPFVDERDRFVTYTHGLGGHATVGAAAARKMGLRPVCG